MKKVLKLQTRLPIELSLCCMFMEEPIKYRTTTVAALSKLDRTEQLKKLSELCNHNANSLYASLEYCVKNNISSFRVSSDLLPIYTHPEYGYKLVELPEGQRIEDRYRECGEYAKENKIRTTCHPDHFVVLNSPNNEIIRKSVEELEYHDYLASLLNIDVMNIHGGGGYGNKPQALEKLRKTLKTLSSSILQKLTLENDDRTYTPQDLWPICMEFKVPLVYDVHHHRCLKDNWTIEEATRKAMMTWCDSRRVLFHISSPRDSWSGKNPRPHHDYIDIRDFPQEWLNLTNVTIDVEAKAKELAVRKLRCELRELISNGGVYKKKMLKIKKVEVNVVSDAV